MSLRVLDPGLQSLLVGKETPGKRSQGIPWGGPADPISMSISNALLGNSPFLSAIEICLVGPMLKAMEKTALACFGAPFRMEIDGNLIRTTHTIFLDEGQTIRFLDCQDHARAYVCVPGGFHNFPSPLKKNSILNCAPGKCGRRSLPTDFEFHPSQSTIRVTVGPEHGLFPANALADLSFQIQQSSNRMGIRLSGNPLPPPAGEMLSEPVCPGTIQVARDGNLLLLGVDGQTIGGYPRVAQVIRADLHKLGQLRPGSEARFDYVSVDAARSIWEDQQKRIKSQCLRLSIASGDFL